LVSAQKPYECIQVHTGRWWYYYWLVLVLVGTGIYTKTAARVVFLWAGKVSVGIHDSHIGCAIRSQSQSVVSCVLCVWQK
jgi:hypothetical protein